MQVRIAYIEKTAPLDPAFYYQNILKLALEKTRQTYGDYQISFIDKIVTADRMRHMVTNGKYANIIWASVTPERKKAMRVIPVNLLRDFNNQRLLLVLDSNKYKFKNIKNLEDLKAFKTGNGLHWTDTKIFKANGIKVSTSVHFDLLIKMLEAGRFDYISRGVHEISNDMRLYYGSDLAIAEGIVLKYKRPILYSYFVNNSEELLAQRIEAGLKLMEEDGSFKQAFDNIASYKAGSKELEKVRHVIELDNSLTTAPN